jgi:hypothetical protein
MLMCLAMPEPDKVLCPASNRLVCSENVSCRPVTKHDDRSPALPLCPLCGKPCPLEDCVTDAEGQAVHKDCYRDALIRQQESL